MQTKVWRNNRAIKKKEEEEKEIKKRRRNKYKIKSVFRELRVWRREKWKWNENVNQIKGRNTHTKKELGKKFFLFCLLCLFVLIVVFIVDLRRKKKQQQTNK